jgi:uncharacterized protein (DUF433 family)
MMKSGGRFMDWTGCEMVEMVPGKVSGVPILKHSRVQADTVLESYELGETVEQIAYSYDLEPQVVEQVIQFALTRASLKSIR